MVLEAHGHMLYVSGAFETFDSLVRPSIAEVNMDTGLVTSWNPPFVYRDEIFAVAADEKTVYVGGSPFFDVAGNGVSLAEFPR